MVAIFCNLEVFDVMKLPALEFADIVKTIAQTLDQKPQLTKVFKMNGVEYGFIPNMEKITLGEHALIDECMGKDDLVELMLSTMYRPIKKKALPFYEIEKYTGDESLADKFKDTPMHIVRGAILFFWTLYNELLQNTLSSIPKIASQEGVNLEEALVNAGGGLHLLSELQEDIRVNMTKYIERICLNHSRYYLT
jgi:hypothetical protein